MSNLVHHGRQIYDLEKYSSKKLYHSTISKQYVKALAIIVEEERASFDKIPSSASRSTLI